MQQWRNLMDSELHPSLPATERRERTFRTEPLVFTAFGVALVGLLAGSYSYGRTALTAAAQAEAIVIEDESRVFCNQIGLLPQSDAYTKCTLGLAEVRRHDEERFNAKAAGIL
jgi:hypothetical protein